MTAMPDLEIAVLVVSCDKYADLWPLFSSQFARYWPDCPFPKYIMMNRSKATVVGFQPLRLGTDVSWSDNLLSALEQVQEEYILLFLEDLILEAPVDEAALAAALSWAAHTKPDHLRLNATEKPDERVSDIVGRISEGAAYRTSTVLTLWRKATLRSLLKPGESAWQFEIDGSERSDSLHGFYSTYRYCFPVINCVIKGKWRRSAVRVLSAQDAIPDLSTRPLMTRREEAIFDAKRLRSRLFKAVPMRYRRALRRIFSRRA
jgi:hypothetical protein